MTPLTEMTPQLSSGVASGVVFVLEVDSCQPIPIPKHRPGEAFIMGGVPFAWLSRLCQQPGACLQVGISVRFLWCRARCRTRWGFEDLATYAAVSESTAKRAVHRLVEVGLLTQKLKPGSKSDIEVVIPPASPDDFPSPLYGPIPLWWWQVAIRQSVAAAKVATACWLLAGHDRNARVTVPTSWPAMGLSKVQTYRGLEALRTAGLVSVVREKGRAPIVTLLGERDL